jgi:hypothetical protein
MPAAVATTTSNAGDVALFIELSVEGDLRRLKAGLFDKFARLFGHFHTFFFQGCLTA